MNLSRSAAVLMFSPTENMTLDPIGPGPDKVRLTAGDRQLMRRLEGAGVCPPSQDLRR
jgi:hypothetical protein